jgi:hypothetical protein
MHALKKGRLPDPVSKKCPRTAVAVLAAAAALALSGCCTRSEYHTDFEVDELDAARPCEEFCERTIAGDDDFIACETRRSLGKPAVITCRYETAPHCQELH